MSIHNSDKPNWSPTRSKAQCAFLDRISDIEREGWEALKPTQDLRNAELQAIARRADAERRAVHTKYDPDIERIGAPFKARIEAVRAEMDAEIKRIEAAESASVAEAQ